MTIHEYGKEGKVISFTGPATYQITVQGIIDPNHSVFFGDMKINTTSKAEQAPVSTLTGNIKDQSALLGVLNALNNMRFPIISIKTQDIS